MLSIFFLLLKLQLKPFKGFLINQKSLEIVRAILINDTSRKFYKTIIKLLPNEMTNDTIDHKSIQSTAYLSVYHSLDDADFLLPAISFSSMVVGKLTKCNVSSSLRTSTGGPCGASDTHTHTAKWANFPRPNAASPSPSSSPSPIGFFYASKFLVSQPATIWSVVVLNSRLGQGSKTGTRWWRSGWRWKTELN